MHRNDCGDAPAGQSSCDCGIGPARYTQRLQKEALLEGVRIDAEGRGTAVAEMRTARNS